ncbi:hypothetical protein EHH60_02065 [Bradyrhizobium sp. RP6]|nr:hypothetical protein EHH60_02065 [Bradyrhizobium sp. RP6]
MKSASRIARTLLACSLLTISLAACQTTASVSPQPEFSVPHESTLVLDPAPKSRQIKPGIDARVAWKLEEARADENARRLVTSKSNVRNVRLKAQVK